MDREIRIGTGGTVFAWATTAADAEGVASKVMGIPAAMLSAKRTGLIRPGGYEVGGNAIDGYSEATGDTMARWSVKAKGSK